MNCGIEWSAKSWLKGPIEKGAKDGQQAYGDGLVKVLKSGLVRPRAATSGSKGGKSGKKKSKKDKSDRAKEKEAEAAKKQEEDWGLFEPARGLFGPVVGLAKPLMNSYVAFGIILLLLFMLWFRKPASAGGVGFASGRLSSSAQAVCRLRRDVDEGGERVMGLDRGQSRPWTSSATTEAALEKRRRRRRSQ